jgi:hypothetical protein
MKRMKPFQNSFLVYVNVNVFVRGTPTMVAVLNREGRAAGFRDPRMISASEMP